MTNFDLATRVPFIIRAPWIGNMPRRSAALVELVDLAPTMAALAGIPMPEGEVFDGVSLVPLLDGTAATVKNAAFSQYPRRVKGNETWKDNGIIHLPRTEFTHMGYTVRTDGWRYTEWVAWNQSTLAPIWATVAAQELYDHRGEPTFPTDFDLGENVNVVSNESFAPTVQQLSNIIRTAFGGAAYGR